MDMVYGTPLGFFTLDELYDFILKANESGDFDLRDEAEKWFDICLETARNNV